MIDYILLIKTILIVYTITRFEPLQWMLEFLPDNLIFNTIKLLLSCSKCLSLYLGSIIFMDLYVGMALSFFFTIFEKTIGKWLSRIDLRF